MPASLRARLTAFRRKFRVTVPEMATFLGMTPREYRSLERGLTHALPISALPLVLAGMRYRLAGRTRSADSRARKNAEQSKTRADVRRVSQTKRPSVRDSL